MPQVGCALRRLPLDGSARQAHARRRVRRVDGGTRHPDRHAARAAAAADRGRRQCASMPCSSRTTTPTTCTASTTSARSPCERDGALPHVRARRRRSRTLARTVPVHRRREHAPAPRHDQAGGVRCTRSSPACAVRIGDARRPPVRRAARAQHACSATGSGASPTSPTRRPSPDAALAALRGVRGARAQRALPHAAPHAPLDPRGGRGGAAAWARERTFFTHLTHQTSHAELAALAAARASRPAYDGLRRRHSPTDRRDSALDRSLTSSAHAALDRLHQHDGRPARATAPASPPSSGRRARAASRVAHARVLAQHDAGALGFLDLPGDEDQLAATLAVARRARRPGGRRAAARHRRLGARADRAPHRAAAAALERARRPAARGGYPRLHVLDNVDPRIHCAPCSGGSCRRARWCS